MGKIFTLIICLLTGFAYAQSEEETQKPVPPVAPVTEKAAKSENKQHDPKNGTFPSQSPVVVNVYAAEQREVNSGSNQGQSNKNPSTGTDWWVAVFTGLLVLVTGGLIYVGWRQNESTRTIERAYVTMSHVPLPNEVAIDKANGRFQVRMQVMNFGRTPATVTEVLLIPWILPKDESLPKTPDYQRAGGEKKSVYAFLVTGDKCFVPWEFPIDINDIPRIEDETQRLWLYGYIDYIDQFKQPHCAGYARMYEPAMSSAFGQTSLVFIAQDGYNYDRPRQKDKG